MLVIENGREAKHLVSEASNEGAQLGRCLDVCFLPSTKLHKGCSGLRPVAGLRDCGRQDSPCRAWLEGLYATDMVENILSVTYLAYVLTITSRFVLLQHC